MPALVGQSSDETANIICFPLTERGVREEGIFHPALHHEYGMNHRGTGFLAGFPTPLPPLPSESSTGDTLKERQLADGTGEREVGKEPNHWKTRKPGLH